jgi:hypothetical protein
LVEPPDLHAAAHHVEWVARVRERVWHAAELLREALRGPPEERRGEGKWA